MTEQYESFKYEYAMQREKVADYYFWMSVIFLVITGLIIPGVVIAWIYSMTYGKWLPKKQAENLHYWLDMEKGTLCVEQGVYFLNRKTIPLDHITNISLSQGPILRRFGLWLLHIQTAGRGGQSYAEAVLIGLDNPEEVRDALLEARQQMRVGELKSKL